MADIATLGLEVDGRRAFISLAEYDRQLEKVAASGDRVVGSTARVSAASNQYASTQRLTNLEIDNAASEWDSRYSPAANRAAVATDQVEKTTKRTTGGVGRLNNALVTMTRRMVGANAATGQLVDVLGTFAIGVGKMTAILAGLAALALAFQRITREQRAAKKITEDHLKVLEDLRDLQITTGAGGQVAVSTAALQAESARLATRLQASLSRALTGDESVDASTLRERGRLFAELVRVNQAIAAGLTDANEAAEKAAESYAELTRQIENMTEAAKQQRVAIERDLAEGLEAQRTNAATVARDLGFIRTDIEIQQGNERRQIEDDALRAQILRGIELFEEAEKRKTEAAKRAARDRAEAEIEQQRRIRNIARGADILGGVIGGTFGGGLQGGAGGALTGLGLSGGNPLGAIIGGAVGFVGGLFSAGRRAREAERLAREAARVAGETLAERRRLLREELNIRSLTVAGDFDAAELARLDARQRQERAAATGLSGSDIELLGLIQELERDALIRRRQAERAIEVAQEQLDVLNDQLSEQERTVDTFRNIVANLGAFGESLSLGTFSPLSPSQRLAEARSQFEALRSLALSGDISAAESLPEASRRLLEASRAFNASGLGFVEDFTRVQDTVTLVRDQFAAQLSVEESILGEMIAQRELLEAEIRLNEQAIEDAQQQAADAIAAWREIQDRQEARDQEREDREAERRRREKEGEAEEDQADRDALSGFGGDINDGLGEVADAIATLAGSVNEERDGVK